MTNEEALRLYEKRNIRSPEARVALQALRDRVAQERRDRGLGIPPTFKLEVADYVAWAKGLPRGLALSGRRAIKLFRRYGMAA